MSALVCCNFKRRWRGQRAFAYSQRMQYVYVILLLAIEVADNLQIATCFFTPRVKSFSSVDFNRHGSTGSIQLNERKRHFHSNTRAQEIVDLLVSRFEIPSDVMHDSRSKVPLDTDWKKLQRFLYRVTTVSNEGLTVQQTRKVLDFLDSVVSDRSAQRSIVLCSPRILTKNVRTRLRPTVDFLLSLYGNELLQVAIRRNPDLLLTSGTGYDGDHLDLVGVFLHQDLNISRECIGRLKLSHPQLFQLSIVQLLSVVSFLRNVLEPPHDLESGADVSRRATKIIGKLVQTHPMIFHLSVDENLKPRLLYLQDRCCFRDRDLASLIKSSSGAILGLSVNDNLGPTIDLLSNLVSVSDLRKLLLSHPQILGLSLDNLRSKIDYFHKIDQLDTSWHSTKMSLASRVLIKAPAVYSLSLQGNIVPTVQFLARIWGQSYPGTLDHPLSNENDSLLGSLLRECPTVLSMSLHGNIQPTVQFYVRAGYLLLGDDDRLCPLPDGKKTVIRGRYITASLFTRLLPRWHYCQRHSTDDDFVRPPLYVLAGATDKAFCSRFGYNVTDYVQYKQSEVPGLKFRSQFETWIVTGKAFDP